MADILKINSKKKCYVIHNNLLLVDVPFDQLSECVAALNKGETGARLLWARYVYKLDNRFKMKNDRAEGMLILNDGARKIVENAKELENIALWLSNHLKKRHFLSYSIPVSNLQKLIHGLIAAMSVIVLAIVLFGMQMLGVLEISGGGSTAQKALAFFSQQNIIFTTICIEAVIGLSSIIAFIRGKAFTEIYEFGYKSPTYNRRWGQRPQTP